MNVKPYESYKPPFERAVPIEKFEEIKKYKEMIKSIPELIKDPKDRPVGANLIQEKVNDAETPNEVKLEAMEAGVGLIQGLGNDQDNLETAKVLIDMVRGERDSPMRVRLASVLSHSIQIKFKKMVQGEEDPDYDSFRDPSFRDSIKRREAFELLATTKDVEPIYSAWARALLKPKGFLQVMNSLYEKESSVDYLPRVLEEYVNISEAGLPEEPVIRMEDEKKDYSIIRLNPFRIYTPEAEEKYREFFGRAPSLYITRRVGKQYVHVEFSRDLSQQISEDVKRFRDGELTREQLIQKADRIRDLFFERMPVEQREELLQQLEDKNLEIRFSTLRPKPLTEEKAEDSEASEEKSV